MKNAIIAIAKMVFRLGSLALACCFILRASAGESGSLAVVVYNSHLPDSKTVAMHYAGRRNVPSNQVFGLPLPMGEVMSRAEYREQLEKPLLKLLVDRKLFVYEPGLGPEDSKGTNHAVLKNASIRYAVLCYGVPARIAEDPGLKEPGSEKFAEQFRRNGAAVDSELSLLPIKDKVQLTGIVANRFYNTTNDAAMSPTNGLLMVARLDGPTVEIARGLVDKAIQAETDGLWGRGYFDVRGLTNGMYKPGDDSIRLAEKLTRAFGFETTLDEKPETFRACFPMSHIAFYAGWYDGEVSGPFKRPDVEFMPGAFAYHLHSFSAATIRSKKSNWVGPLLADGATATMGCVDEPYLTGTPDMGVFFGRWLMMQFSFGEAAYASQPCLSWQTTVIGDPLYRPFAKPPQLVHQELLQRHSKLIEWSHLRVVDLCIVKNVKTDDVVGYLVAQTNTATSAILSEKLAQLYSEQGKPASAIRTFQQALKLDPSPQQKARLTMELADKLMANGENAEAFAIYEKFVKQSPEWLEDLVTCQKLRELANKLNKPSEASFYAKAVKDLTGGK